MVVQADAGQSAGIKISEFCTRIVHADFGLNRLTAVGIVRHVSVVVHPSADLHEQRWRKNSVVIDRRVPKALFSGPGESAIGRSPNEAKEWRLAKRLVREAEAPR